MDEHKNALPFRRAWLLAAALLLAACGAGPTTPPATPPAGGAIDVDGFERFASREGRESAVFEFTNTGSRTLDWTLEIDQDADNPTSDAWFDADPASGTLAAGESTHVTLTLRSGLPDGTYRADLRVEYEGGPTRFEVAGVVGSGVSLSADPARLTLAPGESASTELAIDTTVAVNVEVAARPDGWDGVDLVQDPDGTVRLIVPVPAGAEPGEHEIVVEAALDADGPPEATLAVPVEVTGDGTGGGDGDARATGTVTTPNLEIPLTGAPYTPRSGAPAPALAAAADDAPDYAPGELLVRWADDGHGGLAAARAPDAGETLEVAGLTLRTLDALEPERAQRVALPEDVDVLEAAERLEGAPGVLWAEPNWRFHRHALPDDPRLDEQWHLPVAGVPYGWDVRAGIGSAVTLAVIDSGFDLDHEDLADVFLPGYDFCPSAGCSTDDDDPGVVDALFDTHGTHVAGIAAAHGGNGVGVAGVARTGARRVVPVKVFPDDVRESNTAQAVADAIRWAAGLDVARANRDNANPADVITLSLGSTGDSTEVRNAVRAAQDAGALVVAAAGNSGTDRAEYPVAYEGVLGVGSVNSRLQRSCFSNTASVDLVAPGGDGFLASVAACDSRSDEAILSTFPGDDYGYDAGTSMAAPIVAAAAAIVWSQNPDWSAERVAQRLIDTAYPPGGSTTGMGAGVVRLDAALGLPGPGDEVTVRAQDRSATATLDAYGSSTTWTLTGLEPGRTTFTATAEDAPRERNGNAEATLEEGETRSGIEIRLE